MDNIKPIEKCPHCGSDDAYYFRDYGVILHCVGLIGEGRNSEGVEETELTRNPTFAFCWKCHKKIRLSLLRGTN